MLKAVFAPGFFILFCIASRDWRVDQVSMLIDKSDRSEHETQADAAHFLQRYHYIIYYYSSVPYEHILVNNVHAQ